MKKANALLSELEENQRTGQGPQTLKEMRAIESAKKEKSKAAAREKEKKALSIHDVFHQIYYPQIQKEKKSKTYEREESLFRLWIDKNVGALFFWEATKGDIESVFYDMGDSGKIIRTAEYAMTTLKQI